MKKSWIFISAGLAVAAAVLYMYNTAADAINELASNSSDEDVSKKARSDQQSDVPQSASTPAETGKKTGASTGAKKANTAKKGKSETVETGTSKVYGSTDEAATGNVD